MKWVAFLLTASTAAVTPITAQQLHIDEQSGAQTFTVYLHAQGPDIQSTNLETAQILSPEELAANIASKEQQASPQLVDTSKEKTLLTLMLDEQETQDALDKTLEALYTYVDRTPYVFSGSTPRGWDCSGLTTWFYKNLGIDLEHSASAQLDSGIRTTNPKPGDVVAFSNPNSANSAYHVGIYIGDGKMIHSPKPGHRTAISDINKFAGSDTVTFVRFLKN